MPFVSKRQNRWAWATRQKFRRRWADETNYGAIPERATKAEDAEGAAPAPGKKMTPAERAKHAALVRWGKKNPFAQRLEAIRKRKKGGGKGKAPAKPDKAAEQAQQRTANMAAAADALMGADAPIGKVGLDALAKFAAGESLDPAMAKELASLGVLTMGADGTPRLNGAGRSLLRAAEKGDARAVVDAAFAAGERVGVGAAGETLPGWEQGPDGTRRKVKAPKAGAEGEAAAPDDKTKAEKEKKGGGGGGGGGKEAKPTEDEKKQKKAEERAQTARDTAEAVGLSADEADFLRGAAEGNLPDGSFDAGRLMELGLVVDDGDTTITTDAGRRALLALERGDQRGYQAALQDVRAAQGRAAAAEQRKADTEARRAQAEVDRAKAKADAEAERRQAEADEVTALLDDWEAGRVGLSYRDQRRAVRAGLARYDDAGNIRRVRPQSEAKMADWRWAIKQTASERAMFANMGSSGGGGGKGGGGKPSGGTGGLWKRGPDGKRTPSAGFQTPPKPGTPRAERAKGDAQSAKDRDKAEARGVRVPKDKRDALIKSHGDKAEAATRERFKVEKDPMGADSYVLRDYNRATSSYRGVTVAEGTRAQVERKLDARVRSARTRAENGIRDTMDMIDSDASRGFYSSAAQVRGEIARLSDRPVAGIKTADDLAALALELDLLELESTL